MERIETLVKEVAGQGYDTRKKLNRAACLRVPSWVIEEIEDGKVESETIADLAENFPIFHYKTCLTIHGLFQPIENLRVGRFKNLTNNQNGTLQVKYSAIDIHKKRMIWRDLTGCTDWRYITDSLGDLFYLAKVVNRENYVAVRTELLSMSESIKGQDFWGGVTLVYCRDYLTGASYLKLEVKVDAILTENVKALTLAMFGGTEKEFDDAQEVKAMMKADDELREAERQAEYDRRDAEENERIEELSRQIVYLPAFDPTQDVIGVKVWNRYNPDGDREIRYGLCRIVEFVEDAGYIVDQAFSIDLPTDFDSLNWERTNRTIKAASFKEFKALKAADKI